MFLGPLHLTQRTNWEYLLQQVEDLQTERGGLHAERNRLHAERDRLHNERDRLFAEQDRLRAEMESLRRGTQLEEWTAPLAGKPTREAMFDVMKGWTSQFDIDGKTVGGPLALCSDARLFWHLDIIGGAAGKRVLELGPLEGAHTKTLIDQGAREVIAIEGFAACWLRCLIVKEVFQLNRAQFLFGNFCDYVAEYEGPKFDFVLAAGVLYHQENPVRLIFDLARLTDQVLVWSQVAGEDSPDGPEATIDAGGRTYRGKLNDYRGSRTSNEGYCGGLCSSAFWMYPNEMRRAFMDAGFRFVIERRWDVTPHGPCVLFVASKSPCGG